MSLALMGTRGREKLCVIKTVRPEVLADPTARARVQRETAIARRLTHGAIAQTFADGEEDGAPYLVQEFVHGWTLSRLLTSCSELRRWPSIPLACHIAQEVARALAYVHTADDVGVIHRDIAPENIMVAYSGEVKVIDFGIAKAVGDESSAGHVVGRFTYGAPEIWQRGADARSDIYGLGVVLWSLLAQRRDPHPFLRDRHATRPEDDATIEAPPAPSTFNSQVPLELDAVVLHALAYFPEDRFQDANEFRAALARFIPREGFAGENEMKQFLRKHVDPADERARLAEMTRGATGLLDEDVHHESADDEAADDGLGDTEIVSRRPRGRILLALLGLFAAGIAASMFIGARPQRPSTRLVSPPVPRGPEQRVAHQATPAAPPASVAPSPTRLSTAPSPARIAAAPVSIQPSISRPLGPPPRTVTRGPGSPPAAAPAVDAKAQLRTAAESFAGENMPAALALARLAARNGAGAPAYVLIGRVLTVRNDLVGAAAAFVQAVRLDPSDERARALLEGTREQLARTGRSVPPP